MEHRSYWPKHFRVAVVSFFRFAGKYCGLQPAALSSCGLQPERFHVRLAAPSIHGLLSQHRKQVVVPLPSKQKVSPQVLHWLPRLVSRSVPSAKSKVNLRRWITVEDVYDGWYGGAHYIAVRLTNTNGETLLTNYSKDSHRWMWFE